MVVVANRCQPRKVVVVVANGYNLWVIAPFLVQLQITWNMRHFMFLAGLQPLVLSGCLVLVLLVLLCCVDSLSELRMG